MASNVSPIETFKYSDDSGTLHSKWLKWKRGFQIFLEASNVTDDKKKLSSLLHYGGLDLQEIYYTHIVNKNAVTNNDTNVYVSTILLFDNYFSTQKNIMYERYLFRQLKQEDDETVNNFINRLKDHALKCYFDNSNDHIIAQIIDKCNMIEIKKKC